MDWYELLPKILNMSLTASVISVTVIILRLLLKRAPKVYSYMLWSVVLFRLLCPITINTPLSVLGLFDPQLWKQLIV
ncbi:MAG: M56 family metallopeptidase [Waltera sp.]